MKTAMQELIDWLKFYDNEPIKPIILKAQIQSLLEKEKEQIMNAHTEGYSNYDSEMTSKEYYNQTYNN